MNFNSGREWSTQYEMIEKKVGSKRFSSEKDVSSETNTKNEFSYLFCFHNRLKILEMTWIS